MYNENSINGKTGLRNFYKPINIDDTINHDTAFFRFIKTINNKFVFVSTSKIRETKYNQMNNELFMETNCGVKKVYVRKTKKKLLGNGTQPVSIPITKRYDFVVIDDGDDFWILPNFYIHNKSSTSNYIPIGKRHIKYKNNFALFNMTIDEMENELVEKSV